MKTSRAKRAYLIWKWASSTAKQICWPESSNSGAGAIADGCVSLILYPIRLPFALPFYAIAKIARYGFARSHQVAILRFSGSADMPTSLCLPPVKHHEVCVLVLPDGAGGFKFPTGTSKRDDAWMDATSVGITGGHVFPEIDAWSDIDNELVSYSVMMAGTVPAYEHARWIPLSHLGPEFPEEAVARLAQHRKVFEHNHGTKFDVHYTNVTT